LPEVGTAEDALAWIRDSSLPDAHRDHYRQFVEHFPHLTFCRGTKKLMGFLSDAEARHVPEWFGASLATLAYALPFQDTECQFFEDRIGDFELLRSWHALRFNMSVYEQFVDAGASMHPITVAEGVRGSTSGLVIDANSERPAIHSYDAETYEEHEELDAGLEVAFASYAQMLASLRSMKIVCGDTTWIAQAYT
jgi:hypothetical protein